MTGGFQGRVLKAARARTVYVDATGAVVKRFHNPSAVQGLRDRGRAASELRMLTALRARDLPVPQPLGVRRQDGSWEIVMERIEDAVPLAAVLEHGTPAGALAIEELARALGELLARAHAAGLDHPDLHPGNILVDGAGRPWLVDFHQARMRERLPPAVRERDLVSLVGAIRETMAPAARALLLEAFLRAEPAQTDVALREAFIERIEQRAREHRRAAVAHARGRWTRESSVCCELQRGDGPLFLRRGLDPALAAEAERHGAAASGEIDLGGRRALLLTHVAPVELREHWYCAARLCEHHVGALHPLVKTPRVAAFGVPEGAHKIAALEASSAALGALIGALHDRGLEPRSLGPVLWEKEGALLVAPPSAFVEVDARPARMSTARRRAPAAEMKLGRRGEREFDREYDRAYAAAFRGSAAESEALARELGVGPM